MLKKHKRLTKKELKKDPFVIFTAQALDFIKNEGTKIGGAILIAVVVVSLGTFFFKSRNKTEINAFDAAFTALQNDAPEALDLLRNVVDTYGGSKRAADVILKLGNIYFNEKDYELSEKYFKQYINKFSGDPLSDFNAYNGLGVVYEEKGEYTKAAATYEQYLTKNKNSPFESMIWMNVAKAYWLADDKELSKQYFTKISEKAHDSNEKQEALYYLQMLDLN